MGRQDGSRMQVPSRDGPAAANNHMPQAVRARAMPVGGVLCARRGDIQQARVGKHLLTITRFTSKYLSFQLGCLTIVVLKPKYPSEIEDRPHKSA